MRSTYVILSMSGYLAATLIAQRMLDQAEAALDAVSDDSLPARTQAQHLVWRSRAELALARDDPATALQIIDQLLARLARRNRIPQIPLPPVLYQAYGCCAARR